MRGSMRLLLVSGLLLAGTSTAAMAQRKARAPELAYTLTEGQNLNAFVRDGKVAAHLLLRNGGDPRILVAFPAGNSGVGLWFQPLARPAIWRLDQAPRPVTLADGKGRPLHGIESIATIDAARLAPRQAVLSNVRFLRDYQSVGRFPAEVSTPARIEGNRILYARDRVDGAPGYSLEIQVLAGRIENGEIVADANGRIQLRIVAATGDAPLTGFSKAELLNARAAADPAARNALAFLSYREKFLAGSWRFDTYFGRDTLMSVRLLMPALRGAAVEAGLGAVLARLNPEGEVAHEEGLSEFALIDHAQHHQPGGAAATLDYGMIDDDYMLGPVAADYLLGPATRAAAQTFLAKSVRNEANPGGAEPAGTLLVRNLRFVIDQVSPFAQDPRWSNLVAIHKGRLTGQWRDSEEGLGRGRYPYDVNAVLAPAALEAADKLLRAGLLDPYLTPRDRTAFTRAHAMAATWRSQAPGLFAVDVPGPQAAAQVRDYAARVGVPAAPALAALKGQALRYHAIALDDHGKPVPIINSDEGFALLFGHPDPADLQAYVGALARPFPAGLMTDIGLLVANPALATSEVQDRFTPAAYHGAVVWSWQQALFAAGLERQLARTDLPPATRAVLKDAQTRLWRAIQATRATQSSELWSWAFEKGRYKVVAFGAGKADVDESNAAQLWSTVYLAVQPPRAPAKKR
jgi:glycogen debranching enzyme